VNAVDLMTPLPRVVTPDEPVLHAAAIMRDLDVGAVPVVADRSTMRPCGIITDRDIAVRHVAEAHHHDCPVRDHMTAGPLETVRPGDSAREVARRMGVDKVRRILVTDGDGRLQGIIALADLARCGDEEVPALAGPVLATVSIPDTLQRL